MRTAEMCMGRIVPEIVKRDGVVVFTADHVNCGPPTTAISPSRHVLVHGADEPIRFQAVSGLAPKV